MPKYIIKLNALMKILFYNIIFTLFLCCHFNSQAQTDVWNLQRCIEHAYENNLTLQLNDLSVENAKINYESAKAERLPNLNGSLGLNLNFAGTTDPTTFEFRNESVVTNSLGLNSGITLYNGGRIKNQIDKTWMEFHAAELDGEVAKQDISLAIASAYLNVLLAKEQMNITNTQKSFTEEQKINTQKFINAGVLPAGDILDIESQLVLDDVNIINGQNLYELALINLKLLLDLDANTPFIIEEPFLEDPSPDLILAYYVDDIYKAALDNQPSIKKAYLDEKIAKKNLDIAESGKYPMITLGGGLTSSYSSVRPEVIDTEIDGFTEGGFLSTDFTPVLVPNIKFITETPSYFPQLQDNFLQYIGANMTIPIFNRFQVNNSIKQARLSIRSSEINRKVTAQNLNREIRQAYADALAASKNYEASKKSIEALEQSYEFAQKKYNLGVSTAFELLSAQSSLNATKLQAKSNKYDYLFKLKILDYYLGNPIQF